MKIVAIASMPYDLELACFGTLARFIKDGHEVHIIIAKTNRDKAGWTQMKMETLRKVSHVIGVSQVYFTDRFDYSAVTQDNADVLASFVKKNDPALVIMPFWKASNQKRRILAKTSLVACRGIGSILMYELERNAGFLPTVYFILSSDEISIKTSCLAENASLATEMGRGRKANCFNLDLLTMKKYQLPLLQQTIGSLVTNRACTSTVVPRNYKQELVFGNNAIAKIEKRDDTEDDQDNNNRRCREIKQLAQRPYSRESGRDVLVELFESHRMLLVDRDDGL